LLQLIFNDYKNMNNGKLIILNIIILLFNLITKTTAQNGFTVARYDILISEIMADPTPAIGLPEVEYVELFNRTENQQELVGWKLQIGNTEKSLPTIRLDSGGYAVIIASKHLDAFSPFCDNIVTLSSLSLTDGGQTLTLTDALGNVIDRVAYRSSWHSAPIKRDGGWSLELKDATLPCLGSRNWDSSSDPSGGTPGRANSIRCQMEDNEPPAIERATLIDSQTLRIWFSEPLWFSANPTPALASISPFIEIQSIHEVSPTFNALDIQLAQPPDFGTHYTITFLEALYDCAGNDLPPGNFLFFGREQPPLPGDIVINEVLSHPPQGTDADFIEIYNCSHKIIDLRDVKIGSGGTSLPDKAVVAVSGGMQLFPYEFYVLCKNRTLTMEQYACPYPNALYQCDSLPAYANTQGVVWLTNRSLERLDRLSYDEDMHYGAIGSTEGVSLERLRADAPTQEAANWHSAASSVGYATPGYRNSQAESTRPTDSIALTPDIISPDNDGFDDFAEIFLTFADHDNRLTVTIYDTQGHAVCHLVNNELCGQTAHYRWDGINDHGNRVPRGQYLALFRWWNANGKQRSFRKVVSVW